MLFQFFNFNDALSYSVMLLLEHNISATNENIVFLNIVTPTFISELNIL